MKLISIRCPFQRQKYGKLLKCNQLCIEVPKDTKGTAYCRKCKKRFDYQVGKL